MKEPANLIVLRYERVTYHGVGGIEAHGKRLGEGLPNIDSTRTHLNEFPIGNADLREIVDAHIVQMQLDNVGRKRASLKRRRRRTDIEDLDAALEVAGDDPNALAEVIGWPWDPKNVHPFTEGILSVSHEWFLDGNGQIDEAKVDTFRHFALGYLAEEFGDEVLYARLDLDEKTPHLSFLIAPEHENRKTKRRELSHRQHRLFGMEEVQSLFDDEEPDPTLTRRSYELLQDRVADYAQAHGLDFVRGERRAAQERIQRQAGEEVTKRNNISPSRGREIAAIKAAEASKDREAAAVEKAAAERDALAASDLRKETAQALEDAKASRKTAAQELRSAKEERAALAAREESLRIGTQAIIAEELTYAPPTEKTAEGLTWGRNKPESKERRAWLSEKIKPARDWLVGFARSIFGFRQQRDAALAEQEARARAVIEAETRHGREPPQTMLDLIKEAGAVPGEQLSIPNAWALPKEMTAEQIDKHLAAMTNTAICDAYAPTRDARDFTEHSEMQVEYKAGLHHLLKEAERRGLNVELREHHPSKATDPKRARLHTDSPPIAIRVVRYDHTLQRG
ncbi:plasmid recombination protein [Pseudoroseicyclus tamaricis]|uniref:Plasmid recombination enzyme n=1 Tax=Pseudoroseicyclus tamaricis TaxID=2705421 RepID=A0A6B2JFN8_9RHOB|nr:plasmid recombination protein [Pseudoroseicyclus tamaricis]NDU99880.1 hypothetical protein [Pseudoroseicyclus tamaricis]